ncbi:MAG: GNAT family N-acetyltransferase [Candidatus Pacebacteria bacterium]|nr:GNAT family N-acetyltransferase [Candidatus Paceibacterota bacterium]
MTSQNQKIVFRRAGVGDLPGFFALFSKTIQDYFPEYPAKTRKYFLAKEYSPLAVRAQLKAKEIAIYLALASGGAVGYLMVRPITGGVTLAVWLAVDKDFQGRGIASRLLRMWEKEARQDGFHKLHLWTDKRNLRFYKSRGFVYVGKIPQNYYGADDYLFYKTVQPPKEKKYLSHA